MPRLRETCLAVAQTAGLPLRLPEVSALVKLAREVEDVPQVESTYKPKDPALVAAEIAATVRAGQPLSRRQTKQAPWCLWTPGANLAGQPDILSAVLRAVEGAERASPSRALASAYADHFDPNLPGLRDASACLARQAQRWGGTWGQLHQDFAFFDPANGPARLAAAVIAEDRSVTEILRERGIHATSAQGGYARAVTSALLAQLAEGREPDHARRLQKVERYALDPTGSPLFGEQLTDIAEALLRPFERAKPAKAVRDDFLRLILRLLGDPRLRPGKWIAVKADLKGIVIGWLTEQSLRQFLDIVDEIAVERMWKYRRAFWEGVYRFFVAQQVDVQVWVAFGRTGTARARAVFGKEASFAELKTDGKYVKPTHAVLLFKIGDVLIADWNDDGKCHIWSSSGQEGAPKLFKPNYGSNEVQIYTGQGHHEAPTELSWGHGGSEGLTWQRKIADRLRTLTGMNIAESFYRLKA